MAGTKATQPTTAMRSLLLALLGPVAISAQGFVNNCTWRSANLTGSFLGMYCRDDDTAHYGYKWTCMKDPKDEGRWRSNWER
jgi:hypothetical protein